jgi:hypothetical protein
MAIVNAHVVADVVEVSEFPDLAERYAVRGVPKTVVNETVEFVGNLPESMFVDEIRRAISLPSGQA